MAEKQVTKKTAIRKAATKAAPRGSNAPRPRVRTATTPKAAPAATVVSHVRAPSEAEAGTERYWEAVGRRKTAVARVRLFTKGDKHGFVNGKPIAEYFPSPQYQKIASQAIDTMNSGDRFRISAHVKGGGIHAQAEAIRHGTARALILFNADFRKRLKREGLLTRDPRMKERRKFGLKKARKAPQWAKRQTSSPDTPLHRKNTGQIAPERCSGAKRPPDSLGDRDFSKSTEDAMLFASNLP